MMARKLNAYAYARVSSEAQAERGTSIQSQVEIIRKYASDNGVRIVKEFIDEAESATTDNRPQFQEMIKNCRDNIQGIKFIFVWKLSRFARNRIDSVVYKKLLSKQGIRVISISEPIEDTPEGRILEGMIELIDSYYSELLSKESMRGLQQTAKQGFHTGGRPAYGYKLKPVPVGNTVKKVWKIEPKEAEAVKLIYQMHANGYRYTEIIEALEEKGFRPRIKNHWGKSSISEILRKHCYSGTHYFNTRKRKELGKRVHLREEKDRSEWIGISVPQIVDDDTFSAVKEKMKRRKFKARRRSTTQILSGLLVCGNCGNHYVIGDYYRGKYPYYRCKTRISQGTKTCDNRNLRGDELDQVILGEVTDRIFTHENLLKYRRLIEGSTKDEIEEQKKIIKNLEASQKELERKKAIYFSGIEEGKLSLDLVSERLEEIKTEEEKNSKLREEAEERLRSLPKASHYPLSKKEFTETKKDLRSFLQKATPQQKHLFLSKFIKSITIHPEKIVIEYIPPVIGKKKSPGQNDQGDFLVSVASPTGFEPVLPA